MGDPVLDVDVVVGPEVAEPAHALTERTVRHESPLVGEMHLLGIQSPFGSALGVLWDHHLACVRRCEDHEYCGVTRGRIVLTSQMYLQKRGEHTDHVNSERADSVKVQERYDSPIVAHLLVCRICGAGRERGRRTRGVGEPGSTGGDEYVLRCQIVSVVYWVRNE